MDCTYYFTLMSEALDGELTPRQRQRLDEHLSQCPHCAAHFHTLAVQSEALRLLDCHVPEELFPQIMDHLPSQEASHPKPTSHVPRRVLRLAALAACTGLAIFSLPTISQWFGSKLSTPGSGLPQTEALIASPEHDALSNAPCNFIESSSQDTVSPERHFVSSPKSAIPDVDASPASPSAAHGISGLSEAEGTQYYEFQNPQYLWLDNGASPGAKILGSRDSLLSFLSQFPQDESHLTELADRYDTTFFQTNRLLAVVTESADPIVSYSLDPQGLLRSQVTLLSSDIETAAGGGLACLIFAEVGLPFEDGEVLDVILS